MADRQEQKFRQLTEQPVNRLDMPIGRPRVSSICW